MTVAAAGAIWRFRCHPYAGLHPKEGEGGAGNGGEGTGRGREVMFDYGSSSTPAARVLFAHEKRRWRGAGKWGVRFN